MRKRKSKVNFNDVVIHGVHQFLNLRSPPCQGQVLLPLSSDIPYDETRNVCVLISSGKKKVLRIRKHLGEKPTIKYYNYDELRQHLCSL
ncbi:hypothetical protein M0804_007998 [Polistes exclamans]|nr:hypothetical protein M0804_007998 [Polistes exclamans]